MEFSRKLQTEADALMEKSGILKLLSKYGQVSIHGSYCLDLMVDGDIDIDVVNPKMTKKMSLEALNKLIKKDYFRGYLYYDFTTHFHPGFPPHYYVGLKTRFRGRKWKIDIWFIPAVTLRDERLIRYLKKNLTPRNRRIILDLKYQSKTKKLEISSYQIYLAVMKKGVKNLKELRKVVDKK